MTVEMAIWRMSKDGPVPLKFASLDLESRLEDMLFADPSLTGTDLLVVGRQIRTAFANIIDLVAVDVDGRVHVLELKRDRTPRDAVAQLLDYGAWAKTLSLEDVSALYAESSEGAFDEAFARRFGASVPDVFNAEQQLTIVASQLDPASERIIQYLAENFGVPVNAVFFRHFTDEDADYLARTWLISPEGQTGTAKTKSSPGVARPWNGRDFYVVLGTVESGLHRWASGRRYGFVGAGGGAWYWKPLRNLTPGKRVLAYVGGAGYVGLGEVTGEMVKLRDLTVDLDGQTVQVVDQPEIGASVRGRAVLDDDDMTEYAVPVRWIAQRDASGAVKETGLFASQVTCCKLRDARTLDVVYAALAPEEA
ncbi:MAG: endonuclease NucS domain-containing protein [Nocardioidaceae bacterium]